MKLGSVLAFLMFVFFIQPVSAQTGVREVIAYWSFNDNYPGYNNPWTFPIAASIGSGQMTTQFSSVTGISGTPTNATSGYASGNAIRVNVVSGDSGKYFTLTCPKEGYSNLIVSMAINKTSNGGYTGCSTSYSIDGSSYSGSIFKYITSTTHEVKTYNFEQEQSIDGEDLVYFRIALSGSNTIGNNVIDNIQITGTPIEETLPCELHAFAATPGYQNSVNLSWITHSETGLLGYKLYRNDTDDLSSAIQVSPLISASNSSTTQTYCYIDTELSQAGTYYYWLEIMEGSGFSSYTQPVTLLWNPVSQPDPPPCFDDSVCRVYPNPFNADTTIHYELSKASDMSLEVFNARGQKVRTLDQASRPAGSYNTVWDGHADNGMDCSSGVYRLVLVHDGIRSERKVVLLQ
jgi:hypothetical protein